MKTSTRTFAQLKRGVAAANDQINVQGSNGNWNYNAYMLGMFNGMECVLATIEGRDVAYRDKPDKGFLDELTPKNFKPVVANQRPGAPVKSSARASRAVRSK